MTRIDVSNFTTGIDQEGGWRGEGVTLPHPNVDRTHVYSLNSKGSFGKCKVIIR